MRIAWLVVFLSLSSVACAGTKSPASYAYARGAAAGGPPPNAQQVVAADPTASAGPGSTMAIPEALVIEGSLAVQVEEIGDLLPALHTAVAGMQGRIVNEVVSGAENSWSASLKIRVPPQHVDALVELFAKRGVIIEKRINATDVSKQLFDQELAIKNLRTTLDRLTLLMQKDGLNVQQILEVEKEMTRVRGQIDQLEGDHRFLKDRVGLATLDVSLSRAAGSEVTVAQAKAYPGARFAMLVLIDPGTRPRTRIGGGFVIHSLLRNMSIELDMFQKEPDGTGSNASREFAAIGTIGGATYSEFLGNGKRQFGNPYLGLRLGYAYLDGSRFVAQGEAGLELFKSKYVILDASVRASGLIGSEADMAVVLGAGAVFAF